MHDTYTQTNVNRSMQTYTDRSDSYQLNFLLLHTLQTHKQTHTHAYTHIHYTQTQTQTQTDTHIK